MIQNHIIQARENNDRLARTISNMLVIDSLASIENKELIYSSIKVLLNYNLSVIDLEVDEDED